MCTHRPGGSSELPVDALRFMKQAHRAPQSPAMLDALIEETTVDASGDDEKLRAFRQAFEDHIAVPCDAFVIGEPVSVIAFGYDGNARRGLTARCRRQDGADHVAAAADVVLALRTDSGHYLAAYRRWQGLDPLPSEAETSTRRLRRHKAAATDLNLGGPIELVALSVKDKAVRCRVLGSDRAITLRAGRLWHLVPGEIVVVRLRRQWSYAGHPYLSGTIESTRLDVPALGLVPLKLEDQGTWHPDEESWGEEGEPVDEWAWPIIARGPRRARDGAGLAGHLTKLSEDDLIELNRRIVERLQLIRSAKGLTQLARFSVGMVVEFETEDGRTISGTVARLNRRTATVVTPSERWRVSPSRLRTADVSHASGTPAARVVAMPRRQE
jgi:hypothetical protein